MCFFSSCDWYLGLITALPKDCFRVVNSRGVLPNDCSDRVFQLLHVESDPPYSHYVCVFVAETGAVVTDDMSSTILRSQGFVFSNGTAHRYTNSDAHKVTGLCVFLHQPHLSAYKPTLFSTEPSLFSTKISSTTYRFSQATSLSTATSWFEAYFASVNLKEFLNTPTSFFNLLFEAYFASVHAHLKI
ncbi:Uncharacterized protein Rs2_35795 [Raphanus sativus]|nr:Uncharacterized protein Rs2_35795 [Raphanus sativus]